MVRAAPYLRFWLYWVTRTPVHARAGGVCGAQWQEAQWPIAAMVGFSRGHCLTLV